MSGESPGVRDLAAGLREVQSRFGLASVSGSMDLPDGHTMTMRWSGDVLELEREDGEWMPLNSEGVR